MALVRLLHRLRLSAIKTCRSSSHVDFSWFDLQRLFERLQHLHQALLKLWRLQTHKEMETVKASHGVEAHVKDSRHDDRVYEKCLNLENVINYLRSFLGRQCLALWLITHQTGNSLIINNPVLLLSQPLDIYEQYKKKPKKTADWNHLSISEWNSENNLRRDYFPMGLIKRKMCRVKGLSGGEGGGGTTQR